MNSIDLPTQHRLEGLLAYVCIFWDVLYYRHQAGELIAAAVSKKGWDTGWLHLGVLVMEFYKTRIKMLSCEAADAVLDQRAHL